MYSVSVAMAAYNGEKYIKEQLESILYQLSEKDEIIISLDPSQDNTKDVIKSLNDQRIKVFDGPAKGVKKNFENAIEHCQNDIIFLADQDDLWIEGKVEKVLSCFDENVCVVLHDAKIINQDKEVISSSFFKMKNVKTGFIHNLIKNGYMGCCMAFRKELVPYIVPIPENIYMHDQWIGMVGEVVGKNVLIHEPYLLYRRHGDNVSDIQHGTVKEMIHKRIQILKAYFELKRRIKQ